MCVVFFIIIIIIIIIIDVIRLALSRDRVYKTFTKNWILDIFFFKADTGGAISMYTYDIIR